MLCQQSEEQLNAAEGHFRNFKFHTVNHFLFTENVI